MGRIDRSAGPEGCWLWLGARNAGGYGTVTIGQRSWGVHVLVYRLEHGPLGPGQQVCHTCDNPPCCNPAHLFAGSALDNQRDSTAKGRAYRGDKRGEANGRAKLTVAQVAEIRAEYDGTRGQLAALARRYGVSRPMIGYIVRGTNWKHV